MWGAAEGGAMECVGKRECQGCVALAGRAASRAGGPSYTRSAAQRLPASWPLLAAMALLMAASLPSQAGALTAPTPTTSAPCNPSSCTIEWETAGDGSTEYLLVLLEEDGSMQQVGSYSTDAFARIDQVVNDLLGCTNLTAQVKAMRNSNTVTGNTTIIPVEPTGSTPVPDPPTVTVVSSDRINVTFTTNDLPSTKHWVHTYTISLKAQGSPAIEQAFSPTFPPMSNRKTFSHEFTGLQDGTQYQARVSAASCAGTAESSAVSKRTSRRIVIDGNANDPVFVYAKFNVSDETQVLESDDVNLDLFYAALSVAINNGLAADLPNVARSDIATVAITTIPGLRVVLEAQINTTERVRGSLLSVLSDITTPPCLSDFTQQLADFSNSFSRVCVTLTASSAGVEDRTATEAPQAGGSSSDEWQTPVIIAGASLGGVILVSILIYLIVQNVRTHRAVREERESKVDLGLELSHATLY